MRIWPKNPDPPPWFYIKYLVDAVYLPLPAEEYVGHLGQLLHGGAPGQQQVH